MSVDAILKEAEGLPLEEQVELAERLWERIAESSQQADLTEAQKSELRRRLDLYRADPGNVIPWETVKAQAKARAGAKP
jgi:putative addiction module component (TIGR02574 family)